MRADKAFLMAEKLVTEAVAAHAIIADANAAPDERSSAVRRYEMAKMKISLTFERVPEKDDGPPVGVETATFPNGVTMMSIKKPNE